MKYIPYIYYTFAILSFLGSFKLMADSTAPLYYFVGGIVSLFVLSSFGALAQTVLNTSKAVKAIASHTELHTKVLKHLTNAKQVGKG